nr:putative ribonuclease H-like domain-containing protein [Tanacetum cinerariifolium]
MEQGKVAQALEIFKLKKRVKKLEKKRGSKSSGLKRLRKVGTSQRVESLTETSVDAELQGRIERKDDDNVATKEVNAAEPTVFDDEEVTMTMAQTLIKMKAEKERLLDEQMAKRLHDEEVEEFSINSTNRVNAASAPFTAVRPNPTNSTNSFNAASPYDNAVSPNFEIGGKYSFVDPSQYPDDPDMPTLKDIVYSDAEEDVGVEADFSNLETNISVSPITTTGVHKDHPVSQIIGELIIAPQTRSMARMGHTQEEKIDYKEVFAPVARIEAIRLFLAYASFMVFMVYQMDVKSAFLYGTIKEEVYVCQPLGFKDPDYPDKVYKVVKALYGLHQAPRAWYETLANYLLENGFQRGKIDQTLFIKKQKGDILLFQVYVDDIIFGSTNKELCKAFEKLMKDKFQMSSMGELTFFLGIQVKQKDDGIFISHDKYVSKVLRKFSLTDSKSASTSIDTEKPLLKDPDGEDVDVHIYRSMIGSLMYLTSSRPDIMFFVCACARFHVTLKVSHLHIVKRIFRYLKGKPHLGLWYPKDSPFNLMAYSDSNYARASLDRKSITGGCQFLGCRLIYWQYKKHTVVAISSTEAKYVDAASNCAQVLWIQNQLLDYGTNLMEKMELELLLSPKVTAVRHFITAVSYKLMLSSLTKDAAVHLMLLELARMGYEKPPLKLTFYKAFSFAQWKFLIHTLVQCVSVKRAAWNEFSCSMASAVICLAIGRKFYFSKYNFDGMAAAEEEDEEDEVHAALTPPSRGRIEAIDDDKDITMVDIETKVDLDAELQGRIERKDDDNVAAKEVNAAEPTVFDDEEVTMTMAQILIKMKAEKARLLDEQMAKRLHDEEVKQAAAREKQVQDDTLKRHDMYMLTEKDDPLSSGVMTLMLSIRLQVEEDSEMARDLVMKIFMKANQPKSKRFFQIAYEDQAKTTFTCPYGTFDYRRMPFRLCNAPATFQRCMTIIFHDMVEDIMEVFMDDFPVFEDEIADEFLDEHLMILKAELNDDEPCKNCFIELNELMELRDEAYKNTHIYKERMKKWHDLRLRGDKNFKVGDKVLLFNSRFKMHPVDTRDRILHVFPIFYTGPRCKEIDEVEQRLAKKNKLKVKGTLLMALPDKNQLKFNIHKDSKSLMEAIKKRLQKVISQLEILGESISQEDINLKFLRSLPAEWKTHTLIRRNKPDLEEQSLDDLFNNFNIYKAKVKSS